MPLLCWHLQHHSKQKRISFRCILVSIVFKLKESGLKLHFIHYTFKLKWKYPFTFSFDKIFVSSTFIVITFHKLNKLGI